jgi:hypothetical protein
MELVARLELLLRIDPILIEPVRQIAACEVFFARAFLGFATHLK